jgi:hypothetical protein
MSRREGKDAGRSIYIFVYSAWRLGTRKIGDKRDGCDAFEFIMDESSVCGNPMKQKPTIYLAASYLTGMGVQLVS